MAPSLYAQISFWSVLVQLACVACHRARWSAHVFSHVLLCGLFTMFIVVLATKCTYVEKWISLVGKAAVFALCFATFRGRVTFGVSQMTVSILLASLYCMCADLQEVYQCPVSPTSIYATFCVSCLTYLILERAFETRVHGT